MAVRARTRLMRLAGIDHSNEPTTIALSFFTLEPRLAGLVDAARKRGVDADQVDRIEREMCALVDALKAKAAEALPRPAIVIYLAERLRQRGFL
jgi:hypothetical protein